MSRPVPGSVLVEGLVEGPSAAWSPSQDRLEDALRRAGAPEDVVRSVVEGGRASLEPSPALYPRGQFSADPAESLALALEFLLDEEAGGRPKEWFSTLRVTEYLDDTKRESLISLSSEGIRTVGRDEPWVAVPAEPLLQQLLRQWKLGILLLIAAGIAGWLNRDTLLDYARSLRVLGGVEEVVLEEVALDPGDFAAWITLEIEAGEKTGDVVAVLRARPEFPADSDALDALRGDAPLELRPAISALEAGELDLLVERGSEESRDRRRVDLQPLRDGEVVRVEIRAPSGADAVSRLRLES